MDEEMTDRAQELHVIEMLFPLCEAVKHSFGPVPVKGIDVVEL